jgi:hypothetical protein
MRRSPPRTTRTTARCRESWEKQVEATRREILAQVEKSRAALLASAKPHL